MSATCEQVQEKMAAYADREIAEEDCAQIQAHLEQCPACAEAAAVQQQVKEILHKRTPRLSAPVHLRARIRRSVAGGADFGTTIRKIFEFYPGRAWTALAGAAAAVVLITLLGSRVWERYSDPVAFHSDTVIAGRIICADCALMQKTRTSAPHLPSHHLVIQTQDEKIWTIVLSPTGQELLQRTDIASRLVQARGFVFPGVSYIQVTDFKVVQN